MICKKSGCKYELETINDLLKFDGNGSLVSFKAKVAPEQEFIEEPGIHPAFEIQYLDDKGIFRRISSCSAEGVNVQEEENGRKTLVFEYTRLAGMNLSAKVQISASPGEEFSYWSISVSNGEGLRITDVQFPFIIVKYRLNSLANTEAIVRPFNAGQLIQAPKPEMLEVDCPHAWQFHPENSATAQYPGLTFAQFLAFYNDRAGIYVACNDTQGHIKLIKPVHRGKGIRLGIAHVGDWPLNGERKLEYEVVVGSFQGDWYSAAEIYREWSRKQHWAKNCLKKRDDMPAWIMDSPPHIIVRLQGELDIGPTEPKEEFLPYIKIIPLLKRISEYVQSPLAAILMSWERPGPWIYPDCFPPVGGEESMKEFASEARRNNWHVGSFCNGTRWVVGHYFGGYDGEKYFNENGGIECVCHMSNGGIWKEHWDSSWRPSYPCCMYVKKTREIAVNFVKKLMDIGLDWIQFLDQNVGCSTFPCYASEHGHQSVPGIWMTEAMKDLLNEFQAMAKTENEKSGRQFVFSVECPPNEYFMPYFQICDVRVSPPGHRGEFKYFIPLYHYLYHEYILIQGGFGLGPEPYHLQIKNAYNFVVGEIPGGVLMGNGDLLNKDTQNWAPWEDPVGDQKEALEMLRVVTAARCKAGKEFVVYGKMVRPAEIQDINIINWQENGKDHSIPAIFHSAWETQDGRHGLVIANWANKDQSIRIRDERLGANAQVWLYERQEYKYEVNSSGYIKMNLPPLSCAVIISG